VGTTPKPPASESNGFRHGYVAIGGHLAREFTCRGKTVVRRRVVGDFERGCTELCERGFEFRHVRGVGLHSGEEFTANRSKPLDPLPCLRSRC
jgi:hypothetical protein